MNQGLSFLFLPFSSVIDYVSLFYLDPLCGLRCPDASYTNDEWRRLVNLTQAGSGISLACMAFLIVSCMLSFLSSRFFTPPFVYLVYVHLFIIVLDLIKADKRKFPATTHLYEFVATSMFSISFLLGGSNPEKNVWCSDEGTYATQNNNTTCAVQGMRFKMNKRKK